MRSPTPMVCAPLTSEVCATLLRALNPRELRHPIALDVLLSIPRHAAWHHSFTNMHISCAGGIR